MRRKEQNKDLSVLSLLVLQLTMIIFHLLLTLVSVSALELKLPSFLSPNSPGSELPFDPTSPNFPDGVHREPSEKSKLKGLVNPVGNFCNNVLGLVSSECAEALLGGNIAGPTHYALRQAAANCAAKQSQQDSYTKAVYAFLGSDPSDMLPYAQGDARSHQSRATRPIPYHIDANGDKINHVYTPADAEKAGKFAYYYSIFTGTLTTVIHRLDLIARINEQISERWGGADAPSPYEFVLPSASEEMASIEGNAQKAKEEARQDPGLWRQEPSGRQKEASESYCDRTATISDIRGHTLPKTRMGTTTYRRHLLHHRKKSLIPRPSRAIR